MDLVTTSGALHVIADGMPLTGSTTVSPDGLGLQFKPDIQFNKGALVTVIVDASAEDSAGQHLAAFISSFTVVKDSATGSPAAIAISASTTAIDVRFDMPLDGYSPAPSIRTGNQPVPSHWELRGGDSLRIVPDEPLDAGRQYRLALDAHTEFPLRLAVASTEPAIESSLYDGVTARIRFDREINPLSVEPGTLKLSRPDGTSVAYFVEVSLDRRELVLRPATSERELIVTFDGPESAGGVPVRRQRYRLAAPPR